MDTIFTQAALSRRQHWVSKIHDSDDGFALRFSILENDLSAEIDRDGVPALLDHLRLAGDIPECYEHDSSAEKLYSKYTDLLLTKSFQAIGLKSITLEERGDSADVEAFGCDYSLVADAKAFRLSRTAKNQKDFKVHAMANWKRGNPYALVVCPIYQLPKRSSQIYQQASRSNVGLFTYSHLAVLINLAQQESKIKSEKLLYQIFQTIEALNPSKDSIAYWTSLNRTMLSFSPVVSALWKTEKQATVESIAIAKEEALNFLAAERRKIMSMSHEQALSELIRVHNIENRIAQINAVSDSGIMAIE